MNTTRYQGNAPVVKLQRCIDDTFKYAMMVNDELVQSIQPVTRKALQRYAKSLGLKASGTTISIRRAILEHEGAAKASPATPKEAPKPLVKANPVATPKLDEALNLMASQPARYPKRAKQAEHVTTMGYRNAQRFVKFVKEQELLTLPCKNTGKDNVQSNINYILHHTRFAELNAGNAWFAKQVAALGWVA